MTRSKWGLSARRPTELIGPTVSAMAAGTTSQFPKCEPRTIVPFPCAISAARSKFSQPTSSSRARSSAPSNRWLESASQNEAPKWRKQARVIRSALARGEVGKGGGEVAVGNPAPAAVEPACERAERAAERPARGVGQGAHQPLEEGEGAEFDGVADGGVLHLRRLICLTWASRSSNHSQKAGSGRATIGSTAGAGESLPWSFSASLAVVSSAPAPVAAEGPLDPRDALVGIGVVVGKGEPGRDLDPLPLGVAKEPLRSRDAGEGDDPRAGGQCPVEVAAAPDTRDPGGARARRSAGGRARESRAGEAVRRERRRELARRRSPSPPPGTR